MSTPDSSSISAIPPSTAQSTRVGLAAALWRSRSLWLIAGVGVALSVLASWEIVALETDHARADFERRGQVAVATFHRRLLDHVESLDAISDFYAGSILVEPSEFDAFTKGILRRQRALRALVWVPAIPTDQVSQFEREMRHAGFADYAVRRIPQTLLLSERPSVVFPVAYVAPSNLTEMLGVDLGVLECGAQLDVARDSGQVVHVPRMYQADGSTVWFFCAIYRNQRPTTTVQQRREALHGFVGAAVSVAQVAELASVSASEVYIFNIVVPGTAGPVELLPGASKRPDNPLSSLQVEIGVYGAPWRVSVETRPRSDEPSNTVAVLTLTVGLLVTVAVTSWFWGTFRATVRLRQQFEERSELLLDTNRALNAEIKAREQVETALRTAQNDLEQRVAERTAELAASEQRYRQMFDNNQAVKLLIDPTDGRIIDANQAASLFYGYSRDELLRLRITDINIKPAAEVKSAMSQAQQQQQYFQFVHRLKSGDLREVEVYTGPIDVMGRRLLFSIIHDVTERKRAEAELNASRAELELVVGQVPGIIWTTDRDLRVTSSRGSGLARMGSYPNRTVGLTLFDVIGTHDRSDIAIRAHYDALEGKSTTYESQFRGNVYRSHVRELRDAQGTIIGTLGFALDVSEVIQTKEQLEESEAERRLLATAIAQTADAVFIADANGVVVYVNPAAATLTQLAAADWVGRRLDQDVPLGALGPAAARSLNREFFQAATRGDHPTCRFAIPALDGTTRTLAASASPVRDESKAVINVVLVLRDVTQEAALEHRLREQQKMEVIGTLAGGIAHDFNNQLTGILGYASVLKLIAQHGDEVFDAADMIETAARRAAQLTSQLLGFARMGKQQNIPVDLHLLVVETIGFLARTLEKHVRIIKLLNAPHATVHGDPNQLQQVLMNLAVNARDAMPNGGDLTFETSQVTLTHSTTINSRELPPGGYLVLAVTDTGTGIAPEHLTRVFEPFFTTKEPGKGTGLGLSVVYGIIQDHNGAVEVQSELHRGSTFKVWLPLPPKPVSARVPSVAASPISGNGRILVIDDEAVVRSVATRILSKLGYDVVTAEDGESALALYRREASSIDLVILDMRMPRMNGHECFRQLKALNPNLKVILSTGYGPSGIVQEFIEEGVTGFVQKPYQVNELSQAVAKALMA